MCAVQFNYNDIRSTGVVIIVYLMIKWCSSLPKVTKRNAVPYTGLSTALRLSGTHRPTFDTRQVHLYNHNFGSLLMSLRFSSFRAPKGSKINFATCIPWIQDSLCCAGNTLVHQMFPSSHISSICLLFSSHELHVSDCGSHR